MMNLLPVVVSAMSLFSSVSGLGIAQIPNGHNFTLYAYGGGLGGVRVCAKDGAAFLVDTTKVDVNKTGLAPVEFTKQGSSWLASTAAGNAAARLDMAQFFVPRAGAQTNAVGFLPLNADPAKVGQAETKGFEFYGKLALHVNQQSGALETAFFAQPTGQDGVSALVWDATGVNGTTNAQIELRSIPPSTGSAIAPSH